MEKTFQEEVGLGRRTLTWFDFDASDRADGWRLLPDAPTPHMEELLSRWWCFNRRSVLLLEAHWVRRMWERADHETREDQCAYANNDDESERA